MQLTYLQFVSGLRFQYSTHRITSGGFSGGAQGGPAPFILSKKARIVVGRKAGGTSDKNQAPPYLTINPVKIIDPDRE